MSSDLIGDVYRIWPSEDRVAPCDLLLARLRALDPRSYAAWDPPLFGRAMRAAGVPTRTFRFGASVRRGVSFDSLGCARQIHDPVVYFVERHGFVKIGTTQNLTARLAALDRGDSAITGMMVVPVTLLAVMPGGRPVERSLHELFAYLRYEGEWFLFEGALVSFVKSAAEARGNAA